MRLDRLGAAHAAGLESIDGLIVWVGGATAERGHGAGPLAVAAVLR